MNLTNDQKDEFLKGTLTPNNVVEIVGNDALGWTDLLEYAFKAYSNLADQKKFADTKRYELSSNISTAEEIVKEALENETIDADLAKELAEAFGWEMSKDVDVVITASIRATLTVPIGKSVSDVETGLSVEASLDWSTENEGFEISVDYTDSIEIEEV
jgi:hypothetical protein